MLGDEFFLAVGLNFPAISSTPRCKARKPVQDPLYISANLAIPSLQNIYRWRDTAVSRASDDFYPPDKASHKPHLVACSYNSLFLSALALPDWDM